MRRSGREASDVEYIERGVKGPVSRKAKSVSRNRNEASLEDCGLTEGLSVNRRGGGQSDC